MHTVFVSQSVWKLHSSCGIGLGIHSQGSRGIPTVAPWWWPPSAACSRWQTRTTLTDPGFQMNSLSLCHNLCGKLHSSCGIGLGSGHSLTGVSGGSYSSPVVVATKRHVFSLADEDDSDWQTRTTLTEPGFRCILSSCHICVGSCIAAAGLDWAFTHRGLGGILQLPRGHCHQAPRVLAGRRGQL